MFLADETSAVRNELDGPGESHQNDRFAVLAAHSECAAVAGKQS